MTEVRIRRATGSDAAQLAAFGAWTFADTFGHLYPPEDLERFLEQAHSEAFYTGVLAAADRAVFVAEAEDGALAGYAYAGPCDLPHPEVTPACGELKRLYVAPGRRNGGLGRRLMQTALDWLSAPGRTLWVGVWSENHGARRLYARAGFDQVGDYLFPVGDSRDHEFILRRKAP